MNLDELNVILAEHADLIRNELSESQYVNRQIFKEGDVPHEKVVKQHIHEDSTIPTDDDLASPGWTVLIGNAGAGKSFVLKHAFCAAFQRFGDCNPIPLYIDLDQDLETNLKMVAALNGRYEGGFSWAIENHAPGVTLFLDSLDERILNENRRFTVNLRNFLTSNRSKINGCLIACRRSAYDPTWFNSPTLKFATSHVDFLDDFEFKQLIDDEGRLRGFYDQCDLIGISNLLTTPFDGFYLARKFLNGQTLPRSRTECFQERIDAALRSTSEDTDSQTAPPRGDLQFLAECLAAIATFSLRSKWTAQDVIDLLGSSRVVSDRVSLDPQVIDLLLHRPLFSRDGKSFSFTHQLFREFLTASFLSESGLETQHQLLRSDFDSSDRVCPRFRGVAASLGEQSSKYFQGLLKTDPLVAYFSESLLDDSEWVEKLMPHVIRDAVFHERYPWWDVAPHGYRPTDILRKLRPTNPAEFLRPFLDGNRIERMWGTAWCESLGGEKKLNPRLVEIAIDGEEHIETRRSAIKSIIACQDKASTDELLRLLTSDNDRIFCLVVRLYRIAKRPSLTLFLSKFKDFSRRSSYSGSLSLEIDEFVRELDSDELKLAFNDFGIWRENLGDYLATTVRALIDRITGLGPGIVDPETILDCFEYIWPETYLLRDSLVKLFDTHQVLMQGIFALAMQRIEEDTFSTAWDTRELLASCETDSLIRMFPSRNELTPDQISFVESILARIISEGGSHEHFQQLKERAPEFVTDAMNPQRVPLSQQLDEYELTHRINSALDSSDDAVEQTSALLSMSQEFNGRSDLYSITPESIESFLKPLPDVVVRRVLDAFLECSKQIEFKRSSKGSSVETTPLMFEAPVWVLWNRREGLSDSVLRDWAACYGFTNPSVEHCEAWGKVLLHLRDSNIEFWRSTIRSLIELGGNQSHGAFRQLIQYADPFLSEECRGRLCDPDFEPYERRDYLDYWLACNSAEDSTDLMLRCYQALCENEAERDDSIGETKHWFIVLIYLMSLGDDSAWAEFSERLEDGTLPHDVSIDLIDKLEGAFVKKHARSLADFYAHLADKRASDFDSPQDSVLRLFLLNPSKAGYDELNRIKDHLDPGHRATINYNLIRIEDQLLETFQRPKDIGQFLDGVLMKERSLTDFVVIAPLREEREAVLRKLDKAERVDPTDDDIRIYFRGNVSSKTRSYSVVVVSPIGMGRVDATTVTNDAIVRWNPRYVLLVGIAGGCAQAEVGLGDILIADQIADYEQQKLTSDGSDIRWKVRPTDSRLLNAAKHLTAADIEDLIEVPRPEPGTPQVLYGSICTGDKVVANRLLDQYREVWSKLIGVEMEAGGAAQAIYQSATQVGFFMIRAVSDLADEEKGKSHVEDWRMYACDVAAAFTIGLLKSGPIPPRDSTS